MSAQPWIKSYPKGVRPDVPLDISSLQSVLEKAAARFGDKPALQFMDKRMSYAELDALANRAAAGFQKLGVKPGVHVGLYLPNTPHYVIAFFGVLKAGGTVVNYSPLDALHALEFKVRNSETDILVTVNLASTYPQAEKLLETTRLKAVVIGEFAEFAIAPDAVKAHMTSAGMLSEVKPDARRIAFRDLLDNDGRFESHPVGDPADAVAVLAYTGGTTGSPKGAMLTHANLTAACSLYREVLFRSEESTLREGEERFLCILPLFHIYSLVVVMLLGFSMGCGAGRPSPVRSGGRRSRHRAQEDHRLHGRADDACRDPQPARNRKPWISRRFAYARRAGRPCPVAVKERWDSVVGCRIFEGWGMTETSPIGTFTPREAPFRPGSCGIPYPGTLMKLVDVVDPTREVAPGERGEICVKGPNIMKGYWKNPEATANSMTADGFFRTGDVGTMDEDGYVYIVDRTKDMLLCGGFNVYPRNIEEAIYQHPSVEEVSVIGIPDDYRGETPKAFVKLKAGAPPPRSRR